MLYTLILSLLLTQIEPAPSVFSQALPWNPRIEALLNPVVTSLGSNYFLIQITNTITEEQFDEWTCYTSVYIHAFGINACRDLIFLEYDTAELNNVAYITSEQVIINYMSGKGAYHLIRTANDRKLLNHYISKLHNGCKFVQTKTYIAPLGQKQRELK